LVAQGHIWSTQAITSCKAKCGPNVKVVISVREPYSWWRSLYTYGWYCEYAATCTLGAESFSAFVHRLAPKAHEPQSFHIHAACGSPCQYDDLIHTETMKQDWLDLLNKYNIPPMDLPHMNPSSSHNSNKPRPPPTVFTQAIVDIIHRVDASIFSEFGYPKRHDVPFELP